jgi:signal transduction histidine kinase
MSRPVRGLYRQIRENTSLFVKAGVILVALSFLEFLLLVSSAYHMHLLLFYFVLFKLVEILCLIHILFQMNRIREGGQRVVGGDYSHPIDTRYMIWEFKQHAENINNVGDGIAIAVDERMKSERFKTELITNVSHDIKTPLTSIINYVDLLKKEPIDNPTAQEYLTVLDRQSARLKKLIEDLIEASKASTGNLPVNLEVCDATVMLTQVVGEFRERAEANSLDIVVDSPEPPVNIMADGRHLWRIIDNLMSNICKYALPGTRVYIDLERTSESEPDGQQHGRMVVMTFRNISRDRLNISSDELMARFVRGDSSRNTEGNGLGLSIAKSLADLMDASLAIEIDGDLFKVVLCFEENPSIG